MTPHLPPTACWVALAVVAVVLAVGFLIHEYLVAPLVDEDEQPIEGWRR